MAKRDVHLPSIVPAPGFYYHYKHDPEKGVQDYAYEILGAGIHTEEDQCFQVYRPLYEEAFVFQHGKMFDLRPLAMAMENVIVNSMEMPRFRLITDTSVIRELKAIRDMMYP